MWPLPPCRHNRGSASGELGSELIHEGTMAVGRGGDVEVYSIRFFDVSVAIAALISIVSIATLMF
jgi:hypothetical protein